MKEPLDELLVQACAAQQRADLAALEQLEPANVPMPFVPQVRRTPPRLLNTVIIAAVCAVLATTAYAFWPRVAVILEGQPRIPCRAGSTAEQHPHGTNAADLAAGWLHRDMGRQHLSEIRRVLLPDR